VKNQAGAFPWEGWCVNALMQSSPGIDLRSVQFTDRKGTPMSFCDGSVGDPKGAKNPELAAQWMKTVTSMQTWLQAGAARERTVQRNKTMFTGLWTANKGRRPADQGQVCQGQRQAGLR
jgi:multiple sugar transport system substrate-binding protein